MVNNNSPIRAIPECLLQTTALQNQCLTSQTSYFHSAERHPSRRTVPFPRLPGFPEVSHAGARQECEQDGTLIELWKLCMPRLPEEPLRKDYPPEGRSERFTDIPLTQLQEKLLPLHPSSGTQTVPRILSPVSGQDTQHQGIQCFFLLLTRCNFIQFQAINLKLKNGRLIKNALQEIIL